MPTLAQLVLLTVVLIILGLLVHDLFGVLGMVTLLVSLVVAGGRLLGDRSPPRHDLEELPPETWALLGEEIAAWPYADISDEEVEMLARNAVARRAAQADRLEQEARFFAAEAQREQARRAAEDEAVRTRLWATLDETDRGLIAAQQKANAEAGLKKQQKKNRRLQAENARLRQELARQGRPAVDRP